MANTEQIPYPAQAAGLSWGWETFPDWMEHLRRLPKGVNVLTYLPVNPLLSYVVGPDEAKRRPPTQAERARMRELLHEAMDAGAIGFSFSYLGVEGNSHVDFDQSPMPTDVMDPEEAFNLCEVIRERGGGMIQLLSEMPAMKNAQEKRAFVEQLAIRSGGRVINNVIVPISGRPDYHRDSLRWLAGCRERGLDIWMQSFIGRGWSEFNIMDMNAWDCVPVFRTMSQASTSAERLALVRSQAYRDRLRSEYDPERLYEALGPLELHYLVRAGAAKRFAPYVGRELGPLAQELDVPVTDLFLDILSESELEAELGIVTMVAHDADWKIEIASDPKVLLGSSDGGAHGKFNNVAYWSTDYIMQLVRETGLMSLEQVHNLLSARPAEAFELENRGTLEPGKAADMMIYDYERLNYEFGRYEVLHDLPNGEWRRSVGARGVRYTLVNGEVTFEDGECTGATSGSVLTPSVGRRPKKAVLAAAE